MVGWMKARGRGVLRQVAVKSGVPQSKQSSNQRDDKKRRSEERSQAQRTGGGERRREEGRRWEENREKGREEQRGGEGRRAERQGGWVGVEAAPDARPWEMDHRCLTFALPPLGCSTSL